MPDLKGGNCPALAVAPGPADVSRLLEAFASLVIVVVGDVIFDAYVDGSALRLSREAPVPVVSVERRTEAAGGAANVAVSLASLGAEITLLSVVGRDAAGERALEIAAAQGVDVGDVVVSDERESVAKRRVLADAQMLVRFDEGTVAPLTAPLERRLAALLARRCPHAHAIVVADYGAGVMTDGLIAELGSSPPHGWPPVVVDARRPSRYRAVRPLACTPSFKEAEAALGHPFAGAAGDRASAVSASGERLLDVTGAQIAGVTLDRDGAVVLERHRRPHRVYTEPVPERCCAGAGDTFTAAFALGLAAGADAPTAAEVAAAAAAVVVAKPGTATCSPPELRLRLLPGGKLVPDTARLAVEGDRHRREGRRIVFANGCFDILHRGHVAFLNAAKEVGDVLVVAVNGDDSVRRLKGPGRPINPLADRIEVLAALSCVDHLVVFDQDRADDLLGALRPDVMVKGGDYSADSVPERARIRALGGELRILDLIPDHSTTRIVERVRSQATCGLLTGDTRGQGP